VKPFKWSGFQVGNRFVAELLALHSAPACRLMVETDQDLRSWGDALEPAEGWRVDLRSHTVPGAPRDRELTCRACRRPLREGDDGPSDAPLAIVAGPKAWFCSAGCREAYAAEPGRVWRPAPLVSALAIACTACNEEMVVELSPSTLEHEPSGPFEQLADWMSDHLRHPLVVRAR
jgi:hypothetical protein